MGVEFDALPPEAKRAAFAHMDAKRKAGGLARFKSSNSGGKSGSGSGSDSPMKTSGSRSLGSGQRHKAFAKAAKPTDTTQSPENAASTGSASSQMSHPELYHVATPERAESIRREGFRNMDRDDGGGKVFGPGTYLSLTKKDSDGVLKDMLDAENGDEIQIPISANVNNPFKVQVLPEDRGYGQNAIERTLRENGLLGPDEHYGIAVDTLDERLAKAGYDAIELKEDRYTHDVMGSQLVVFDPKVIKYGHDKPTEKPVEPKGRRLGSGARHKKAAAIKTKLAENEADSRELDTIGEQMKSRQITPAQARERIAVLKARSRSRSRAG